MRELDFLDTNVLVYAFDTSDLRKHTRGRALVTRAVAGEFAVSVQVLSELASILISKYQSKFTPHAVMTILDSIKPIPLVKPDAELVRRAVEACEAYGIHFYDGMIVAAAERARAEKIFSEDLNAGQKYFGVTVTNPFL